MPKAIEPRNFILHKTWFVPNIKRGAQLIALMGLLAVLLSEHQAAWQAMLGRGQPELRAASGDIDMPAAAAAEESPSATLTPEMRAALDFVAKRYRVSAEALTPVFRAAQATSLQLELDPLLIVAVIAIESRFNPFAESVVGAQGLMQVVPRWHPDKIPEGERTIFDPATNIQVGARILRDSIRRSGSLIPGLQQFAGAGDDPDHGYANKILAEKQRLESAVRKGKST